MITNKIAQDWIDTKYYESAESQVTSFWNPGSIFRKRFDTLDASNIIELACGHGRHLPYYYDSAHSIILIDVNPSNIIFCKKRFPNLPKINFYVNSGSDFSQIPSCSITSIFCYDSMVHFDLRDVFSYIVDAHRVLKPGGCILFHHSNYDKGPGRYYTTNPHWRNYMSANLFKHVAMLTGFTIVSQDILNWGSGKNHYENIDCLSLCQKHI